MKRVANVGPLVFVNLSTASFEVTSTYDVSVMPDGGLGTSAHRIRGAYDVPSSTITAQVDVQPPVTKVLEAGVTGEGAAGTDVSLGFNGINGYLNADVAEIVAVAASTIDPQDLDDAGTRDATPSAWRTVRPTGTGTGDTAITADFSGAQRRLRSAAKRRGATSRVWRNCAFVSSARAAATPSS